MSTNIYKSSSVDFNKLVASLTQYYEDKHFEVQHIVDEEQKRGLVQIKKAGTLRFVTGFGKALGIHIQQIEDGLQVMVAIEDWGKKLASDILLSTIPILTLPVFVGSVEELHFAHLVLEEVDHMIHAQDPNVEIERHHSLSVQ